jgi:hypothetical protein
VALPASVRWTEAGSGFIEQVFCLGSLFAVFVRDLLEKVFCGRGFSADAFLSDRDGLHANLLGLSGESSQARRG